MPLLKQTTEKGSHLNRQDIFGYILSCSACIGTIASILQNPRPSTSCCIFEVSDKFSLFGKNNFEQKVWLLFLRFTCRCLCASYHAHWFSGFPCTPRRSVVTQLALSSSLPQFLGLDLTRQGCGITRGVSNRFCDTFGNLPRYVGRWSLGLGPFCCITEVHSISHSPVTRQIGFTFFWPIHSGNLSCSRRISR